MSVLASPAFRDQIEKGNLRTYAHAPDLMRRLQAMNKRSLLNDSSVHRLHGASEDIYVLRYRDLRVFLTTAEDDIIILEAIRRV
jgi:hypothetical protein